MFRFLLPILLLLGLNTQSLDASGPALKTLVLTIGSDPKSFNDIVAQETSTTQITGLMFEGLTRFDPETGEVKPSLAESWEISSDGLVWTFTLRKGVRWFDGMPLTTRDVVFTFRDLLYNPKVMASARDIFMVKGKPIQVSAVDDRRVQFVLPSPFAPFLLALSQPILPHHRLSKTVEEGGFNSAWGTDSLPADIVGTGPFKLHRYRPGERVELIRNPAYWKQSVQGEPLPFLDRIIFLIVPSAEGRLLKFIEGETDIYALAGQDYPVLKPREKKAGIRLHRVGPGLGSSFLAFNHEVKDPVKRKWFRNVDFRKAVAHGIDRRSMIDIIHNRLGVKQCSPVSPSTPFFFRSDTPCIEFDPGKAKRMLKEMGFTDQDGDGMLEDADGQPVEFVLATNADNPQRYAIAAMVREDLARLGFKVHFQALEFNTLVAKLVATHDWDAVLIGLTGSPDPHFGANVWLSKGSLHLWSMARRDPVPAWQEKIDEIFNKGAGTLDRQERKRLYDEWQLVVANELPLIYTVLPEVVYAAKTNLVNFRPTVLGGATHNIEEIDIRPL